MRAVASFVEAIRSGRDIGISQDRKYKSENYFWIFCGPRFFLVVALRLQGHLLRYMAFHNRCTHLSFFVSMYLLSKILIKENFFCETM